MDQVLAFQITTVKEILRVKPTPSRVSYQSPISFAQFKICSSQQDSPVSKTVFTLFSLFFGGPSLRILDHNCGRDFKGEADAITGQLSVTHLFCIVQDLFIIARQSSFQNSFHALLSPSFFFLLFFGDHNCKRDFEGEADAITGQLLVTHPLCTVQDLFSTARQSTFQNSFHALLYSFWRTRSKHPRSQLTPLRLAISHSSLVHSLRSIKELSVAGNSKRINPNLFAFHGWYFSITSFSNGHKYLWNIENSCCKKLNFREVEKL